jgi:rod shape determining protein RodA
MFDRRLVENFDWVLLGMTIMLASIGIAMIYSAANAGVGAHPSNLHLKQLAWYGIGFVFMVVCFSFNYKQLDTYAIWIYAVCVGLLVAVLFFGKSAGGSQRWISLGPLSLQPSELVKVAVILMLAQYYSRRLTSKGLTFGILLVPMAIALVPCLLIARQPDLGTAGVILLIAGSMTLFVKIERRTLIALVLSGMAAIPIGWSLLKPYQKQRILTFFDPDRDPLGAGYHVIQSKIAIGSGLMTGKGYLDGTQNALAFLPEQHTDFIFSVLAEEWGFLGAASLIGIFLLFLLCGVNIAYRCREPFGAILAIGIVSLILWEVFINIGMVMGILPVVGVPLPFISYGGSSTLTLMIAVGLLLNVGMRRYMFEK